MYNLLYKYFKSYIKLQRSYKATNFSYNPLVETFFIFFNKKDVSECVNGY